MAFDTTAIQAEADQTLQTIIADLIAAVVDEAKAMAPVVSGDYRDGLAATADGIHATSDHSIFVELKHGTIANAVEAAKAKADLIASEHRL